MGGLCAGGVSDRRGKMSAICADSGFWIGLYDERDQFHIAAVNHYRNYFGNRPNKLLIPWPTTYEFISSRMTEGPRGKAKISALERDWKTLESKSQLVFLSDEAFRELAIRECFDECARPQSQYRGLSLVDRVIRLMLTDVNLRWDALITFNLRDFADICTRLRRPIIS